MPLSPEKGRDCSSSLPDLTSTFPLLADDLDEAIQAPIASRSGCG